MALSNMLDAPLLFRTQFRVGGVEGGAGGLDIAAMVAGRSLS